MRTQRGSSGQRRAAHPGADGDARELLEARDSCFRMSHTIRALQDTIDVLRAGANSLAIDNALLHIENERLRVAERSATNGFRIASPKHGG